MKATRLIQTLAVPAALTLATAGASEASLLVDFGNFGAGTSADFTTLGVAGLTGAESVETITAANFFNTSYSQGAGLLTFDFTGGVAGVGNVGAVTDAPTSLTGDYWYLQSTQAPSVTASISNAGLSASTEYTLYIYGSLDSAFDQDSEFGGVNNANVTFDSVAVSPKILEVNFTTSAGYDELSGDTIDFYWEISADPTADFGAMNALAIVEVPEPGSLALLGLGGLLVTRRRRV